MKLRNPKSRHHINIPRGGRVLEVGGGHDPHPKAHMVVDKFVDTNYHRSGDIKTLKHQEFMQADGENLPFEDNEFDYVICCHVLEHVDDPVRFMKEQCRVAKRGYLETPNLMGEYLAPKESHRWLILEIDGKIVMYEKEKLGFKPGHDFGDIFLEYLPQNSIGFKILQRTHADIMTMRFEWQDNVEVIVNPMENEEWIQLFTSPWRADIYNKFLPQRSLGAEAKAAAGALGEVVRSVFKSKVLSKVGL